MTIAVAWRDAETVFVAADSLLTWVGGSPPPLRTGGTFAERSDPKATFSAETGCKVFNLGPGVVSTFAGSVSSAFAALISIRNSLRYGRTLRESVQSADVPGQRDEFRILVGGGPKGDLQLYLLESDGAVTEIYEDRTPIVLGSLPPAWKDQVRRAVLLAYGEPARSPDPDLALANALMAMQAIGRRVNLPEGLAGGAFFGMRSTAGEIYPQSDILYLVFSKPALRDNRDHEFAIIGIRGEGLFAWPLATNDVAIYCTDVGSATDSELVRLIHERLPSLDVLPPFVCLVERDTGSVIAIDRRRGGPPKYVDLASSEPFGVNLLPPVMRHIDKIPDPTPVLPNVVVHAILTE